MTTHTATCDCGKILDEQCAWEGPEGELVWIEHMPEALRDSHVAARNRGEHPANGAIRVRVSRACAASLVDGRWTTLASTPDTLDAVAAEIAELIEGPAEIMALPLHARVLAVLEQLDGTGQHEIEWRYSREKAARIVSQLPSQFREDLWERCCRG
jgi:hypothetical protein